MKGAAIACWIIQGASLFGAIFLNDEPFIPESVSYYGIFAIILFLIPQFIFLFLGFLFYFIWKKQNKK